MFYSIYIFIQSHSPASITDILKLPHTTFFGPIVEALLMPTSLKCSENLQICTFHAQYPYVICAVTALSPVHNAKSYMMVFKVGHGSGPSTGRVGSGPVSKMSD